MFDNDSKCLHCCPCVWNTSVHSRLLIKCSRGKMEILHFLRAIPVDLRPTLDPQNPPPICQGSARLPERDINQDQRRSAKQETSVVVRPRGKVSLLEVTENLMIVCYSFCSWNICYSLLCMRQLGRTSEWGSFTLSRRLKRTNNKLRYPKPFVTSIVQIDCKPSLVRHVWYWGRPSVWTLRDDLALLVNTDFIKIEQSWNTIKLYKVGAAMPRVKSQEDLEYHWRMSNDLNPKGSFHVISL